MVWMNAIHTDDRVSVVHLPGHYRVTTITGRKITGVRVFENGRTGATRTFDNLDVIRNFGPTASHDDGRQVVPLSKENQKLEFRVLDARRGRIKKWVNLQTRIGRVVEGQLA